MRLIEIPFRNSVASEKNRFIDDNLSQIVATSRISDPAKEQHLSNMQRIFDVFYDRTIRLFSTEIERSNNPKYYIQEYEKKASLWETLLRAFVTQYGAQNVKRTSETTFDDVQEALNTALESEEAVGETEIVSSILKAKGLSVFRAETIARTETHNAAMFASEGTAKSIAASAGLTLMKQWVPATDERTRESHVVMAGSDPIPMNAYFDIGGERLLRPGDPNGSAGNIINCRCILTYKSV